MQPELGPRIFLPLYPVHLRKEDTKLKKKKESTEFLKETLINWITRGKVILLPHSLSSLNRKMRILCTQSTQRVL